MSSQINRQMPRIECYPLYKSSVRARRSSANTRRRSLTPWLAIDPQTSMFRQVWRKRMSLSVAARWQNRNWTLYPWVHSNSNSRRLLEMILSTLISRVSDSSIGSLNSSNLTRIQTSTRKLESLSFRRINRVGSIKFLLTVGMTSMMKSWMPLYHQNQQTACSKCWTSSLSSSCIWSRSYRITNSQRRLRRGGRSSSYSITAWSNL